MQQAQGSPANRSFTGSFVPEDHPQVLFVLGLVNQAITPKFPGLAEILKGLYNVTKPLLYHFLKAQTCQWLVNHGASGWPTGS